MEFEIKQYITRDSFVTTADGLLAAAEGSTGSIEDALTQANEVSTRLEHVQTGELEVQPPLSGEQIASYRRRAGIIINIAKRGKSGLQQTAAIQQQGTGSSAKAEKGSGLFRGKGSGAKS
ncbi:MAG: hypothetical protein JWL89_244 [Candidatus Saccharibacteria bacterium]|nr:hypothetical protein [Candidatus Saccharibacteria bacterium]